MTLVEGKGNKLNKGVSDKKGNGMSASMVSEMLEHEMSPDKERHLKDHIKHPATNPYPHPDFVNPYHKTLHPYHYPHIDPVEFELNVDHGTHQDRPKPYKSMVKNGKAGKKKFD